MIRGIVPPMITPLRGPEELDVTGLERLLECTECILHGAAQAALLTTT